MASFFGFLSKNPENKNKNTDTSVVSKTVDEEYKGISENTLIGKGAYKEVFNIKEEKNGSFMVDNDFNTDNYVIANITIKNEEELENLQEELKIQIGLAEDGRAVNVLQINYNFKRLPKCNIKVSSSEDIDTICNDMKNNIGNLEKISILMEKCTEQTIWSMQKNIEKNFNDLIEYLVDDKKIMLIDIKPANLCNYQDNLIALDLDPQFIIQDIKDDTEAKEAAKACMFLIFSINLLIHSENINKSKFINNGLKKYFGNNADIKSILKKINYKFGNDKEYNVPYMIRHYYSYIDKSFKGIDGNIDDNKITEDELKKILKKKKTRGGIKNKNKKKTQKKRT